MIGRVVNVEVEYIELITIKVIVPIKSVHYINICKLKTCNFKHVNAFITIKTFLLF